MSKESRIRSIVGNSPAYAAWLGLEVPAEPPPNRTKQEGSRRCQHCCQEFKTPLQCRGHMVVCLHNDKYKRCEFCGARCGTETDKKIHEDSCSTNPALWCDWCGLQFPHCALREKHQRRCHRNPEKTCRFCGEEFESVMAELMHRVFCTKNPSTKTKFIDCAACCEERQCIAFPCGAHHYCSRCLLRMARIGIKDRTQLPLHCCKHEVKPGNAVDVAVGQLLPEAQREKYQEAMLLKFAKDVMYCPQHDCGALIVLDELNNSSLDANGPIGCPKCCHPLCHRCKSEWHAGMTCDQYHYISAKSRDAFTRFCRDMRWMRCFECGHVVEKRAGCNHITCVCGANFCYLCGASWGSCKCQVVSEGHALRHNRVAGVGEQHVCQYCRQAFDSQMELGVHIRVCRTAIEQRGGAYECASCLSRFPNSEALLRHRRGCRAAKQNTFLCRDCGTTFSDQMQLRRHRRACGADATVPC